MHQQLRTCHLAEPSRTPPRRQEHDRVRRLRSVWRRSGLQGSTALQGLARPSTGPHTTRQGFGAGRQPSCLASRAHPLGWESPLRPSLQDSRPPAHPCPPRRASPPDRPLSALKRLVRSTEFSICHVRDSSTACATVNSNKNYNYDKRLQ